MTSVRSTALVRRALRSDVDALVALMREFYAEAYALDPKWAQTSFERLLTHSDLGCVWLAECRGVAAGHAVLTLRYTMEHGALRSRHQSRRFAPPRLRLKSIVRRH